MIFLLKSTSAKPRGDTNSFLPEMVQKCPDGPKRVPNCQKHLVLPFRTLMDPFGPLWNVDKPAMFGHFCLFYWCVFLGHPVCIECAALVPSDSVTFGYYSTDPFSCVAFLFDQGLFLSGPI